MNYIRTNSLFISISIVFSLQNGFSSENLRFKEQTTSLDEVRGNCAPSDTCLLLTYHWGNETGGAQTPEGPGGKLWPYPMVSLIRPANSENWLALNPRAENLPDRKLTLFPMEGGCRGPCNIINGLNVDIFEKPSAQEIASGKMLRKVFLKRQLSVYQDSLMMNIGKVEVPILPDTHAYNSQQEFPVDSRYSIAILAPLKFNSGVKLNLTSQVKESIRHVKLVGVPNPGDLASGDHGNPYSPHVYAVQSPTVVSQIEFVESNIAGTRSIRSLETIDQEAEESSSETSGIRRIFYSE